MVFSGLSFGTFNCKVLWGLSLASTFSRSLIEPNRRLRLSCCFHWNHFLWVSTGVYVSKIGFEVRRRNVLFRGCKNGEERKRKRKRLVDGFKVGERRFKGRKKRKEGRGGGDWRWGLRLGAMLLCLCFNSFAILFVIFCKGF